MSIKLVDSLSPMGSFPVAEAKDIIFDDKENLQDKLDNGGLGSGGGSGSWVGTREEFEKLDKNLLKDKQEIIIADDYNKSVNDSLVDKASFKFGITEDGKYGYIKAGADSVTPFKSAGLLDILAPTTSYYDIVDMIKNDYLIIEEVEGLAENKTISTTLQGSGYLFLGAASSATGYVSDRITVKSYSGCTLARLCGFGERKIDEHYEMWALYLITNAKGTVSITSGGDQYGSSKKIIFKK